MYARSFNKARLRGVIASSTIARKGRPPVTKPHPEPQESQCRYRNPLTEQRCQNTARGKNAYCTEHQ